MAFEDIKAEIALLFEQMVNQPQDAHEIRETVREKLNELKAAGLPCRKIWSSLKTHRTRFRFLRTGPVMRFALSSSSAAFARKGFMLVGCAVALSANNTTNDGNAVKTALITQTDNKAAAPGNSLPQRRLPPRPTKLPHRHKPSPRCPIRFCRMSCPFRVFAGNPSR